MKNQILILMLFVLSANISFGQSKEQKRIQKFKSFLVENDTIKAIKKNKEECEILVRRLKLSGKGDAKIIKQYTEVKSGYDAVLDAIIYDVSQATSIGGLVEQLIMRKERRVKYAELGKKANLLCKEYKESAHNLLGDEKGFWKVLIDWAVGLLPGWVTKISDASLEVVRKILIGTLEDTRFKTWDEIK